MPEDAKEATGQAFGPKSGAVIRCPQSAVIDFEGFVAVGILSVPMTVSAVRPWRTALQRERCLPSSVTGPVLLVALRRLASICLKVVMECLPQQLASFCYFGGHWAAAKQIPGLPRPLAVQPICGTSRVATGNGEQVYARRTPSE
jgi:hypothetical protein